MRLVKIGLPACVLCVLTGIGFGLGGYTVYYAEGLSYRKIAADTFEALHTASPGEKGARLS